MDILINNPLSLMYGPYFLLLYGGVITVTVISCYLILQGNIFDSVSGEIPEKPDPYEVAYLRDGELAVAKVVCLELMQKGFVRVKDKRIERSPQMYNVSSLQPIERVFFDWVDNPRVASDVKYNAELRKAIAESCETYQKSLETSGYFNSATKNYLVGGIGAFLICSLGSYKLISALSRGHHNVMFLILMAIAAVIILAYISYPLYSRVTAKGKQYLSDLKQTFANLQSDLKAPVTEPDYNSSLLLAIFDFDKLKASSDYQDLVNLFVPSVYSHSSSKTSRSSSSTSSISSGCSTFSCGSSCSSGSSCGSSCGGGCGGCGGCGG